MQLAGEKAPSAWKRHGRGQGAFLGGLRPRSSGYWGVGGHAGSRAAWEVRPGLREQARGFSNREVTQVCLNT